MEENVTSRQPLAACGTIDRRRRSLLPLSPPKKVADHFAPNIRACKINQPIQERKERRRDKGSHAQSQSRGKTTSTSQTARTAGPGGVGGTFRQTMADCLVGPSSDVPRRKKRGLKGIFHRHQRERERGTLWQSAADLPFPPVCNEIDGTRGVY